MLKDKRILVTGSSGFVGTNLVNRLVEMGLDDYDEKKVGYIRSVFNNTMSQVAHERVDYYKLDLTDKQSCKNAVEGMDYAVMCAANTSGAAVMEKNPLAHVTPNVIMNTNMLEAAYEAGVDKFIFISSNTVYPDVDYSVKEEDVTGEFFDKYYCVANMKWFGETLCKMYSEKIKNPMITIVLRPGNLYGPYDDFEWETSHVVPAMIRRVIERHDPIEIWGDGKDVKDLLYIDDFIDGLINVLENVDQHDIFNIAKGQGESLRNVLKIVIEVDGYDNAKIIYDENKPTMILKRVIDINKAKRVLGFEPKITLKEGLKRTIKWYKEKVNG